MNKLPLVSIVVISYNQGKYIRENLDSIKAQTYPNIELIVADDASPDKSVEIFKDWLSENQYGAKTNFHTENTGLATVLNECIELATGKYIKLIAADDYLHPQSIEKCVLKLEEVGDQYGMVSSDTYCVDENSTLQPDFADFNSIENTPPSELHDVLIIGNRIATLTVLMRTDVIRETGEYHAEFLVEDYQRWLMISEKYFIAYIPEKLAFYRVHPGNISKAKADRILAEDRMLQMRFDHHGIVSNVVNDYMQNIYAGKKEISADLRQRYATYPFRMKVLALCLQYHIPNIVYQIIFSLSLRLRLQLPSLI